MKSTGQYTVVLINKTLLFESDKKIIYGSNDNYIILIISLRVTTTSVIDNGCSSRCRRWMRKNLKNCIEIWWSNLRQFIISDFLSRLAIIRNNNIISLKTDPPAENCASLRNHITLSRYIIISNNFKPTNVKISFQGVLNFNSVFTISLLLGCTYNID